MPARNTTTPRPRLLLAAAVAVPFVALGVVLRCVLHASFATGDTGLVELARALAIGAALDLAVVAVVLAPVALGIAGGDALPESRKHRLVLALATVLGCAGAFFMVDEQFGRLHALQTLALPVLLVVAFAGAWIARRPRARLVALAALFAFLLFDVVVQYFFFEEFDARYNHIALDYLLYPREVGTNLWESYDVPLVALVALGGGVVLALAVARRVPGTYPRLSPRERWNGAAWTCAAGGAGFVCLSLVPSSIGGVRVESEIAQNGWLQLARAFRTSELDYDAYYRTLPHDEAEARARRVLGFAPARAGAPLTREIAPAEGVDTPLDAVVILEESLGSEFVGALGGARAATPHLDRWTSEGWLLENLVANGNRTVRGLEGVLCSFVPLPGDSITKRTPPLPAATLGGVFAHAGYDTAFFYGGAGGFDGMEPFMSKNGWSEFVEQSDYPDGAFTTAWGVADEHIFDALLARQLRARDEGRRFFGTLMSVSNHRPYLVPQGRTAAADGAPSRARAVAYADWALGRYLDAARGRGLLEHTVVLVVGDHGARVYGAESIPVASYRIPALFVGPVAARRSARFAPLCSQVDLAPTLVALAGVRASAPFLGRDLTRAGDGPGRAFVQHNRDVGMLTERALVVLGLQRGVEWYVRDGAGDAQLRAIERDASRLDLVELEMDAIAVFQTAYEAHRGGRYVLAAPPRLGLAR